MPSAAELSALCRDVSHRYHPIIKLALGVGSGASLFDPFLCRTRHPTTAARPGPSAQGEVEASVKKGFVFVYGVVPAAAHCVNDEGWWGTGVLV